MLTNMSSRCQLCHVLGNRRALSRLVRAVGPLPLCIAGALKRLYSSEAREFPTTSTPASMFTSFGVSCSQGKLKENEDRYDSGTLLHGLSYFAVFDGHRGNLSSEFLKQRLGVILSQAFRHEEDLATTGLSLIRNAFDSCEKSLENELQSSNFDQNIKDHNGSTALTVIASSKSELLLAQTGDSRAVLCRFGEAVCLTTDHTPNNEEEANRIERNGGWIDWDTKLVPYVNGILSMTRSFGNCHLRDIGITHTPFINYVKMDKDNDQFLVLCTDGVSDWMTDDEIVSIASQFDDPNKSAHELTCCARQYGSTDDATAFVIPLEAWKKNMAYNKSRNPNFLRSNVLKRD